MSPNYERQPYDRPHGPAYCFVSADTLLCAALWPDYCAVARFCVPHYWRVVTDVCVLSCKWWQTSVCYIMSGDRRLCVILRVMTAVCVLYCEWWQTCLCKILRAVTDVCVLYCEWWQTSVCYTANGDRRLCVILWVVRDVCVLYGEWWRTSVCYMVSGDGRLSLHSHFLSLTKVDARLQEWEKKAIL